MGLWSRIFGSKAAPATAGASLSGRPSYASSIASLGLIPRSEKFELLAQFYAAIPPLKRSISVLTGMVGTPEFVTGSDADTNDLNQWAATVGYGKVGRGLGMWMRDHGRQLLTYGFGVGEAETFPNEVRALHSYSSPRHAFRSDPLGNITILQYQAGRAQVPLNLETTVLSVHDPDGGNPNGESLFFAIPTVSQIWLDVLHNYRSTWRRFGDPVFHVNWEPDKEFNDSGGTRSEVIRGKLETAWNSIIKSKVVDGKTKDFFSTGKVTVTVIGADGQVMDVQIAKRNLVEEIVVATNLPAWLLGYSWSTTERLSTQQADMLVSFIGVLREEVEGSLHRLVELRQRLAGKRGAFEICWPAVNLQDLVQQAQAELLLARAKQVYQAFLRQLWADGVISQLQYAEELTESEEIATPFDAPQALAGGGGGFGAGDGGTSSATGQNAVRLRALPSMLREMGEEYRSLAHRCNGKNGKGH